MRQATAWWGAGAGRLVLIGGSEDKQGEMRVLRRVVELNHARRVALIPSASSYPEQRAEEYLRAFAALGVLELDVVDVRDPADADRPQHLRAVGSAQLVFFTGGDQVQLVERLGGSALVRLVTERLAEGVTVAGTSAGAAAASDPMIFDGDGRGFRKGAVHHGAGFGLLPGITVDTHFVRRGRIARLAQFLASGLSSRGLGLGEDTAIIIGSDGLAEVDGRGMVTTLSAEGVGLSSYDDAEDGEQLTMDGFRLGFLAPGAVFDLHRWRVVRPQGMVADESRLWSA